MKSEEMATPEADLLPYQKLILEECNRIRDFLLEKNRKYGNSALDPKRIFSKASPVEQIRVRIDDKLKRIETMGGQTADEDTVLDLIGYLILLRIAERGGWKSGNNEPKKSLDTHVATE